MIYLGNDPEEAKKFPFSRRKTDHIVTLSNIEADVRKNRNRYTAAVVQAVSMQMARTVSVIRHDINSSKRKDRRIGDRRGS